MIWPTSLLDPDKRPHLVQKIAAERERLARPTAAPARVASNGQRAPQTSSVTHAHPIPSPPDLRLHVIEDHDLEEIFAYINPTMLYGKHLGLKGNLDTLLEQRDDKAMALHTQVRALQDRVVAKNLMRAKAVYKFFPAQSEGNTLLVYNAAGSQVIETFAFPRQLHGQGLCLSDFVAPRAGGRMDYIALFAVTCGDGIRELSEGYKQAGQYFVSHAVQALAIESAEGFAELLHRRLRAMWGFADPADLSMRDRFKARYRGVRVSFGYPACPRLEDQRILFRLLPAERIGLQLTEGCMMEPEASVSALVFHHPQARYFSILEDELHAFEQRLSAAD